MDNYEKTKEFIRKARLIHGDRYDYSKTVYENSHKHIKIICPVHGEFLQTPTNHLCGKGCVRCSHTQDESSLKDKFIEKCIEKYGDIFDYSETDYKNAKNEITVIDKKYGKFKVSPDKHIQGQIHINRTREVSFIKKAQDIYGDTYSYDNVYYIDRNTPVKILCSKHGVFEMTPKQHLKGKGCPLCKREEIDKIKEAKHKTKHTKTTEEKTNEFIQKARNIHGDKYDYSKTIYKKSSIPVIIICPIHGEFLQTPNAHLSGKGCKKCCGKNKTTEEFVNESIKKHGNKYDYSKVEYKDSKTKVIIQCHKHGEFLMSPNKHLSGEGCPQCNDSMLESLTKRYLQKRNIKYIQEYSSDLLGKQRLDFYIPHKQIAIECQGRQHYMIDGYYFNGRIGGNQDSFERIKRFDLKKKKKCIGSNITVYYLFERHVDINDLVSDKERNKYGLYTTYNSFNNIETLLDTIEKA